MNIGKLTIALALTVCLLGATANAAWTEQAKLTAVGSGSLGITCDNDGEYAILGSYGETVGANAMQGAGHVYVRSGTTWTHQAKLTASDGAASDYMGTSAAINGDTALMGAYNKTVGTNASQGAAYVYTRSGTTWTQQQKLTASDGEASDNFGGSAGRTIDGDNLIIGATGADAAYVYTRSGTTWTEQDILTGTDTDAGDRFGVSAGLDGDNCIVGAYADDSFTGSAYVFTRSGSVWTQQQKLTASDAATSDLFGFAVALDGDTCVVAARGAEAAYVYTRSGTTWTQTQILTASDAASGDRFGAAVAMENGRIIVGSQRQPAGGYRQGALYVYELSGGSWSQVAKLTASDGEDSDSLGAAVSLSGDTVCGGAYGENSGAGAGYIFVPEPVSLLLFAGLAVPVLARRKRS